MPRNHNSGTSTLRNRNRVTNKTRLKVIHGNIDADPLVLDEDEEKARVVSTAGVDAEDANEHHLQAVLSAASHRHQANVQRTSRGAAEKAKEASTAYIPVPDSREVLEGYAELYPSGRWTDPFNYIRSSDSVEEAIKDSILNGFTYYMDERDQEWLEKNNEEARGEGTSVQGSVLSGGTTTRSGWSQRSSKSKGKEPDVVQPIGMSEDEFELVMGIFEKVTHDKTEYLHHGLEQGMTFPPFSDYQDTFASNLPPSLFATFTLSEYVPEPSQLVRLARIIYPHWRDRRLEREGHRIMPHLNFDETDNKNESYICFRRRELKAVRKTRASQVSYSDKLVRLKSELSLTWDLAGDVQKRENCKKEVAQEGQQVWEKRLAFVELKRRYPSLSVKEDDELLFDKERTVKKPRIDLTVSGRLPTSIKLRTREAGDLGSPAPHAEAIIKPRERNAAINKHVERELARIKEGDFHWEDGVDNAYQPPLVPAPQRSWKFAATSARSSSDEDEPPVHRALRTRRGRGGRMWVDRRNFSPRSPNSDKEMSEAFRRKLQITDGGVDSTEEEERVWRLMDRWKFDSDDGPVVGPDGPEEHGRALIDDYDPKYMRHAMTLLGGQDLESFITDPSIVVTTPDGRSQSVIPFRLGASQSMRRDAQRVHNMGPPQISSTHQHGSVALAMPNAANGTPVALPAHLKMMQGPMRISSGGGVRGPPTMPNMQQNMLPFQSSPPHASTSQSTSNNSTGQVLSNGNDIASSSTVVLPITGSPGQTSSLDGAVLSSEPPPAGSANNSPMRPSSQNQHSTVPMNGFHIPVNGFPAMHNGSPYIQHGNGQHTVLSLQQMQNIKSAFAASQPGQEFSMPVNAGNMPPRLSSQYVGHILPNGANFNVPLNGNSVPMNLKLPPQRQMQWTSHVQRPPSVNGSHMNGMDASQLMSGSMSPNQNVAHSMAGIPSRVPSASGGRSAMGMIARPPSVVHGSPANIAHLTPHSSSPLMHGVNIASPQSSPPRPSHTPMASPSLQHQQTQQVVGGGVNGF